MSQPLGFFRPLERNLSISSQLLVFTASSKVIMIICGTCSVGKSPGASFPDREQKHSGNLDQWFSKYQSLIKMRNPIFNKPAKSRIALRRSVWIIPGVTQILVASVRTVQTVVTK